MRVRQGEDDAISHDDDVLCSADGRVRIEPHAILVRRLEAVAMADLDGASDTTPRCDAPADDVHRVEIGVGHLRIDLPKDGRPAVDGHVRVRAPLGLAARAGKAPPLEGWVGAEVDVRYAPESILPDVAGNLEAHGVKVAQFAFAHELHSQIAIRDNVIRSPVTTVAIANGLVTLSDTEVAPLAHGVRIEHMRLDGANIDFTALMRDLGVHPSSWVGWEVRELHAPLLEGTIFPLHIDGDMTGKTYTFGIYDRPAEDHARERIFGVQQATLASRVTIRQQALSFVDLRVGMPHSLIEGALVSLGFDNNLRIEAPRVHADLDDISPIGPFTARPTWSSPTWPSATSPPATSKWRRKGRPRCSSPASTRSAGRAPTR
jgi:translocation and assembly module TamB